MFEASGLATIVGRLPADERAKIVGNALAIAAGVTPKAPPAFAADLHRRGDTRSLEAVMAALGQSPAGFMTNSDFKSAISEAIRVISLESERPRDLAHRAITRMISVPDFRTGTVPRANPVALAELDNTGAVPALSATVSEAKLSGMLSFGGILPLSRQAIISAQWDLLASMATELVLAADRAEAAAVFAALQSTDPLPDGYPPFDGAVRGNVAAIGGAPSATTLASSISALANLSVNGVRLGVKPWAIVAPVELATVLGELFEAGAARLLPGGFFPSPELTGNAWFLIPDPIQRPVLGLVHVGNATDPQIDTQEGFRSDGLGIRGRHTFAAVALSPFGIKNLGQ